MKLRTLFSGIGSPESALKNLGIEYELVDFCEIDKYAAKSYCAIHDVDESKNLGDVSKVDEKTLPYADMMVWGFPCTDISVAGKQAGIVEGETRSGLYYEGLRILKETLPKYSIIENVKNLVGKKFKAEFHQMLADIEELGYTNYWQVLNAKNYGIPQNRERVFIVSIRNDVDTGFEFPQGFDNGLRLKDFLEDDVDEKFYISQEKTEKLISQIKDKDSLMLDMCQAKREGKPREYTEFSPTLSARDYKEPRLINKTCIPCITPDREEKRQNGRRFKEDGEPMFTLTSQDRHGVLQVGNISENGSWENPQTGRIYSTDGISPTLNTCGGGQREPKVVTRHTELPCILDDRDKGFGIKTSDVCPTQRAERYGIKAIVKEATKQGYAIAEEGDSINIQFPNSNTRRGRVGKGVAQTLETSCNQAVMQRVEAGDVLGHLGCWGQRGVISNPEANCSALTASDYKSPPKTMQNYRIRKLTPRTCWRLMGFSDEEFQRAVDAGISNSQLYKQAGNSIVTDVLYHMFYNLLIERPEKKTQYKQISLLGNINEKEKEQC